MSRIVPAALLLLLALMLASFRGPDQSPRERIAEADTSILARLAVPYHGDVYDDELRKLEFDLDAILRLQDALLRSVYDKSDDEAGGLLLQLLEEVDASPELTREELAVVNNAVLARFFGGAPSGPFQSDRDTFWIVQRELYKTLGDDAAIRPEIAESLKDRGLVTYLPPSAPPPARYIGDCRKASVPIPPDWPDPKWQNRKELKVTLVNKGQETFVFAYRSENPAGTCIALPRLNRLNGDIEQLGIICQSDATGRACFWDNVDPTNKEKRLTGPLTGPSPLKLEITSIGNGYTLTDDCTECHRGKNVFLIHPGTPLDLKAPFVTDPQQRYVPIGQVGWSNPGPLYLHRPDGGGHACAACHEIPGLSELYCSILQGAADTTMPSGSTPVGWTPQTGPYALHLAFLRQQCRNAP